MFTELFQCHHCATRGSLTGPSLQACLRTICEDSQLLTNCPSLFHGVILLWKDYPAFRVWIYNHVAFCFNIHGCLLSLLDFASWRAFIFSSSSSWVSIFCWRWMFLSWARLHSVGLLLYLHREKPSQPMTSIPLLKLSRKGQLPHIPYKKSQV